MFGFLAEQSSGKGLSIMSSSGAVFEMLRSAALKALAESNAYASDRVSKAVTAVKSLHTPTESESQQAESAAKTLARFIQYLFHFC